ncbi:MAG: hypothetical protein WD431_09445 [Cyclobacteriaceae bacterium]
MAQFRLLSFNSGINLGDRKEILLQNDEIKELLKIFKTSGKINEALIISETEKTEILYHSKKDLKDWLTCHIAKVIGQRVMDNNFFQQTSDEKQSLNYLAELCFGIQSSAMASRQLFPLFEEAYQISRTMEMNGEYLDQLFKTFSEIHLQIEKETNYKTANFSISHTTSDMVGEFVKKIKFPKIAIIGFRGLGKKVFENLIQKGYPPITIVEKNLTPFANFPDLDPKSIIFESYDQIINVIRENDIIINTLDSQEGMIKTQFFHEKLPSMRIIIDLALQGNMHSSFGQIDQVILFEMTDIHQIIEKKIELNKKCMKKIKLIVSDKMSHLENWLDKKKGNELLKTIKKLLQIENDLEDQTGRIIVKNRSSVLGKVYAQENNLKMLKKSILKIQSNQSSSFLVTLEDTVDHKYKYN